MNSAIGLGLIQPIFEVSVCASRPARSLSRMYVLVRATLAERCHGGGAWALVIADAPLRRESAAATIKGCHELPNFCHRQKNAAITKNVKLLVLILDQCFDPSA